MNENISTPLEIAQHVAGALRSIKSSSLAEYTQSARLSPILLIDKRVLSGDIKNVVAIEQTLLSVYSAFYLQAVNMEMSIGNVKVSRILDQFSTDRSLLAAGGNSIFWSNESIEEDLNHLPLFGFESSIVPHSYGVPLAPAGKIPPIKPVDNDKTIHNITDESNLVVGKVLDVKLVDGDHSITMPVLVTINPKSISSEDFLNICRANSADRSSNGRWHQMRSGEIRFVKDWLLTFDLIEKDKKALLADKTGVLFNARSKRTTGIIAALISGYASPNSVSSMILISKQTANELEYILKGKLTNFAVREDFFKSTIAMTLVVYDVDMERLTLYQRSIADFNDYDISEIKKTATKAGGTDVEAIFKAYQLGNSASL